MHLERERVAEQQLQREKRRCQRAGDGDLLTSQISDPHRLASDDHWAVVVSHARAASTQSVLVGDVGVAVQADGGQFEFAALRSVIQRFDVLQGVREAIVSGRDFVVRQRMKHEGVIRVRAVSDIDRNGHGLGLGARGGGWDDETKTRGGD